MFLYVCIGSFIPCTCNKSGRFYLIAIDIIQVHVRFACNLFSIGVAKVKFWIFQVTRELSTYMFAITS